MAEVKKPTSNAEGCGCLIAVAAVIALGIGGYNWMDEAGYISHTVETTITAEPGWLVGESKTCVTNPLSAEDARFYKTKRGDVTHTVSCDNGPYHQIKVTFWGRTERTDERAKDNGITWKCTKNSDSFTCRDLD